MWYTVPGFDLKRQNRILKKKLLDTFSYLLDSGSFILGPNVERLEKRVAKLCNVRHGVGVSNGSDALFLALAACNVGPGDEVITTPFTFFATAGAIVRAGAKPVFVDIDSDTLNINPDLVEEKITSRTKAVVPVHLFGCMADMDKILLLGQKYGLAVIEDAAQAMGSRYKGRMAGSLGTAGCFSFFPTKNLGAFGDGGMVCTDHDEVAEKIRLLRVHGASRKYHHDIVGYNHRLDEIQAAFLNVKLDYLDEWVERRRKIADLYKRLLQEHAVRLGIPLKLPAEPGYAYHAYHQFTIRTKWRDDLLAHLHDKGIGATVYYPVPLHLQQAFAGLGYRKGEFPVAEAAAKEVLSLPMYPELTEEEISWVVQSVLDFFDAS